MSPRPEQTPPLFAASADPVELVAPVSPAVDALRGFHRPHPELEVHCPWCHRPQVDCESADLHDRLDREVEEFPGAWPINACAFDGRALRDHTGSTVRLHGLTFGDRSCAEEYARQWQPPEAERTYRVPAVVTVPVVRVGGAQYLPGDQVDSRMVSGSATYPARWSR